MDTETRHKLKLKELSSDPKHEKASEGKFRALVIMDSVIYQIEDDKNTREEAYELCRQLIDEFNCIQIFDDKGVAQIKDNVLIPIL
ncbi:MAG: hypothetical protein WCO35_00590 [Candidatus Nomurabacteria bacterium]